MQYEYEYTDTFAGEANYCWVNRGTLDVSEGTSELALVRRVKKELGLSGVPCARSEYGDMIELRPHGMCTVLFITAQY